MIVARQPRRPSARSTPSTRASLSARGMVRGRRSRAAYVSVSSTVSASCSKQVILYWWVWVGVGFGR